MCAVVVQQQYHWTCSRTENSKKKTKQSVFIGLTVNWFTDLPLRCVRAFNCCSPSLTPQLTDFTQCKLTAANYAKVKQTQVCINVCFVHVHIHILHVCMCYECLLFLFLLLCSCLGCCCCCPHWRKWLKKTPTNTHTYTRMCKCMYVSNCVFISIIKNLLGNSWVSAR